MADIDDVIEAIVVLGLDRDALWAPVDPRIKMRASLKEAPLDQIRADLDYLLAHAHDHDGTPPLDAYLKRALRMADGFPQQAVIQAYLQIARAADARVWGFKAGWGRFERSHEVSVKVQRRADGWHLRCATVGAEVPGTRHTQRALPTSPDGAALFAWLLPPAPRAALLLSLCQSEFTRQVPIRLRLVSDDADLHALPWEGMADDHGPLRAGIKRWTIERSRFDQPPGVVALPPMAARRLTAHVAQPEPFAEELRSLLLHHTVHFQPERGAALKVVSDLTALRANLAERTLLYLADLEPAALASVLAEAADKGVQMVCVVGDLAPPSAAVLDGVRVVAQAPDHDAAQEWLVGCLVLGDDPLHAAPAGMAVWTGLHRWEAPPPERTWRPPPELVLDRIAQRGEAHSVLRKGLLLDEGPRLQGLVGLGREGDRTDRFGDQLTMYLEDEDPSGVDFFHRKVADPAPLGGDFADALAQQVEAALPAGDDWATRLSALVELPREYRPDDYRAVLLLDFGVWGASGWTPTTDHVDAWSDLLEELEDEAKDCIVDVRVAALLTVQHAQLDRVKASLEHPDYARLIHVIQPLSHAKLNDLYAYFRDPDNCDDRDAEALAEAVFDVTDGRYADTVTLLQRGHRVGWRKLKRELKKQARGQAREKVVF